jgi:Xaa-Pro dipeptidase
MSPVDRNDRAGRLRDALGARSLDVLLALTPENAEYLSRTPNYIATHWRVPGLHAAAVNGAGDIAVVTGDFGGDLSSNTRFKRFFYTLWTESIDVRESENGPIAERVLSARPRRLEQPPQFDLGEVFDRVAEAVRAVDPSAARVGLEQSVLPEAVFSRLRHGLPGVEFIEASDIFDELRVIKDDDEIANLWRAAELTETGIRGAIAGLALGQSVTTVNAHYQIAVHQQVADDSRFAQFRQAEGAVAVGIGASASAVAPGQTVKFDMQVDVGGYHSDIGRTVAFAPTSDQLTIYAALHDALLRAQELIRPGARFADIYAAGAGAMHAAGFSNYSRGHLGHSVGLTQNFEEPPFIEPGEYRRIEAGMVLSLELPFYVYGVGAFQLERMLLITGDGYEAMDQLPFSLAVPEQ